MQITGGNAVLLEAILQSAISDVTGANYLYPFTHGWAGKRFLLGKKCLFLDESLRGRGDWGNGKASRYASE